MVSARSLCLALALIVSLNAFNTWAEAAAPRAVILAQNAGTEITDLLVPFAILSAAGIEVEIVATGPGPVNLMTGLEILDLRVMSEIDTKDLALVVVPAVYEPGLEIQRRWLQGVHAQGVLVASICDGVEALAAAGVLRDRRATGHFYSKKRRERRYPSVRWVDNVRFVRDGNIVSTAGVSASAPAAVFLVELLVGSQKAESVARRFGVDRSSAALHNSDEFTVGLAEYATGARNLLRGLKKRKYNLLVDGPVDEFSLALAVDALSRTFRAAIAIDGTCVLVDGNHHELRTMQGLRIRSAPAPTDPDWQLVFSGAATGATGAAARLPLEDPAQVVANVLGHIEQEFGRSTAMLVGLQLELPGRGARALAAGRPRDVRHQ